jgi:hypothetical protein
MAQTPEERKEAQCTAKRKYRELHPERLWEQSRKWRKANPDKVKSYKRREFECHHERVLARNRQYRENNLEDRRAASRAWYIAHPDRVRISIYKRKYGISQEDAERLYLAREAGVCAVCGGNRGKKALAVDHDHDTNVIRGLLCDKCNLAFGFMAENPEWIRNLADYAQRALDAKKGQTAWVKRNKSSRLRSNWK